MRNRKSRVDGTWKYKVRLVACGYSQIAGHDFNETFAPTAKFKSICIVLNLAAIFDWDLHGIDTENAFLESDLEETIYMKLPVDTYVEANGKPVIVRIAIRSNEKNTNIRRYWYEVLHARYVCLHTV